MIKSCYEDQNEILEAIKTLHCPEGFECDLTYGNGKFWSEIGRPKYCFDKTPLNPETEQADSTDIPLKDKSLNNIVFDPPFLTYIKKGREHNSIMGKRFSGYWAYDELIKHYTMTLKEANRVLKKKGIMIFKCQDIIHNHKMHCTHVNVINWGIESGFRLKDMFILVANHRMPIRSAPHGRQTQKHARIFHSYFLVLEKNK